jgi:PAS domain S-box-containing protein
MPIPRRRQRRVRRRLGVAIRRWAPPWRRREFWATQALVLAIAAGHAALEMFDLLGSVEHLNLVPESLFLIPVVYAGLNFGLRGALPTAMWCAFLTIPNVLLWHRGPEAFAESWQAGLVVAVGLLVGQRIDREARARSEAERRERERRSSEEKYRNLFESTADPTLLLLSDGSIEEANAAAATLFGRQSLGLVGRSLDALGSAELATAVREPAAGRVVEVPDRGRGGTRWVEPVVVAVGGSHPGHFQVVLRDVTAQQERQERLEEYTRQTLAAREEERRRIARDLHDGPVQELVLLWRKLDELDEGVEGASRERLAEARALSEQIANNLRRVSRNLRPSVLDDLGLGPALNAEVVGLAARSGLQARYVESGDARRLSSDVELTMLRIAQEALHNVERHAHANKAVVRLAYHPSCAQLTIADDGQGFQPPSDARSLLADGRLGLVGMRERTRLVGGELRIRRRRGGGTLVSVTAPA